MVTIGKKQHCRDRDPQTLLGTHNYPQIVYEKYIKNKLKKKVKWKEYRRVGGIRKKYRYHWREEMFLALREIRVDGESRVVVEEHVIQYTSADMYLACTGCTPFVV